MKFERATKEELLTVAGLISDSYRKSINPNTTKESFYQIMKESGEYANVAKDGNNIIGAVLFNLEKDGNHAKYGTICDIAVDEKHRKTGLGTGLLKSALTDLEAMLDGPEKVVRAQAESQGALSILKKLGFKEDPSKGRFTDDGDMCLKLTLA